MKNKIRTPIRYAGGKSRAIKKITPFVEPYDTIVSPFLGGGSLEIHWASNGKRVIASDIFDILVNFWQQVLSNPSELADELSKISPNKEEYKKIKEILINTPEVQEMMSEWKTNFYKRDNLEKLNPIRMAAYYYFNHNCSYGPGFLGWASDIYMNQKKWDKTISKIRSFKLENLSVSCQSFEKTISENQNEFLYLDPPYYTGNTKDNKMLGGIYPMKNIPVHHNGFDHALLRDLLLNHKGNFALSYNNCETIREYYSEFEFYFPQWHYSMDIGEKRIGKNRIARTNSEDLGKVQNFTEKIDFLNSQPKNPENEKQISLLKSERHEIMKKESHEILIVKRGKNV